MNHGYTLFDCTRGPILAFWSKKFRNPMVGKQRFETCSTRIPHARKKTSNSWKRKNLEVVETSRFFVGGDKRDRTADLLNAIQALSQAIIYIPPFVSNEKETESCNKLNGVEKLLDADIQRNSDFIIPVHVHAVDDPGNDHFLCRNIGVIVQVCPLEHIIKLL